MEIVFARTSYFYQSYVDFWRLVELAGFPVCEVKDIDLERDAVYIFTPANGELRPHVRHRRSLLQKPQQAKIVWWDLERMDSGNWELGTIQGNECVTRMTDEILEYVDHIWVSDRYFASLDLRMTFVPMGSDARLALGAPDPMKVYDVCALTYNNHRRDLIYGQMQQKWKMAPNSAWGDERDRILRRSKCMVYVHQTPMPIGAPLRMALAAAYRLPVISETLADQYPHKDGHDVVLASHGEILPKTQAWLNDSRLASVGENLYQKLCIQMPFKKCVMEGVERTLAV